MLLRISVILSCLLPAVTGFLVENLLSLPHSTHVNIVLRGNHAQSRAAARAAMCSSSGRDGEHRVGSYQYIQSQRLKRHHRPDIAPPRLDFSPSPAVGHKEHQVVGAAAEAHQVMHKVGGRIGSIQLAGLEPIPHNGKQQAAEDFLLYSEDEVSDGMVHLLEFDRDEDTIIDFQQLSALHGSIWNAESKETLLGSRRLKATADILKDFNAEESKQNLKILGSRRLGAIYQVLSEGVQEVSNSIEGAAKGMAEGFEGAKKGVSDGIEGAMNFVSSGLDDKKIVPEVSAATSVEPPSPAAPAAAGGAGGAGAEEVRHQASARRLRAEAQRDKKVLCQEMEMAADPQQIFLVASELEHYKDWAGDGIKSVNIRFKESDYIEAVYTAGAFGYIFDFVMGFTLEECRRITFHVRGCAEGVWRVRREQMVESSMIKRLEGAYVFEPLDNFKSKVSFELVAELGSFVPKFIQTAIANLIIAIALGELRKYVESPRCKEDLEARGLL